MMNDYTATGIAEGWIVCEDTDQQIEAWQYLTVGSDFNSAIQQLLQQEVWFLVIENFYNELFF